MQILTIAGNVGKDAVLRKTQGGDAVLGFSVAVDNGRDKEATWYEISVWGKRGEALEQHITKGSRVTVSGRPSVRVHDGKAYLGISASELTLQGGPKPEDRSPRDSAGASRGGGSKAPVFEASDDDIPF